MEKWTDLDTSVLGPVGDKFYKFATERIKGQDKAVRKLARALDRHASGFRTDLRPIYVALVVGGAGSGKTLLASVLAEFWFGASDAISEVACSNFGVTNFSQNALNQHDLKYSGAHDPKFKKILDYYNQCKKKYMDAANVINEADPADIDNFKKFETAFEDAKSDFEAAQIKIAPSFMALRSILVLDHIEDGPTRLQDELSMIFERGLHFDKDGNPVSLRNCVIFVTCNSYVSTNEDGGKKLGFNGGGSTSKSAGDKRYLSNTEEIKNYLSAKFLSHIDRVEIFLEYTHKVRLEILEIFLKDFRAEIADKFPLELLVDDAVKDHIVKEGSDHPEQGIRLLRRKFDKYLQDKIATLIAQKKVFRKDKIRAAIRNIEGKDEVIFSKNEAP